MTPIDFTNDQNTIRRVIYGYMHTINQTTHQRQTLNCRIFTVILEKFAKFGGQRFEFIRKIMYSLVNVENYQNAEYTENNI